MWQKIKHYFERLPGQARVAQTMLDAGLRVEGGHVFCGSVRLAEAALGRGAGVDRRVVTATVRTIQEHEELRGIFSRLRPVAHLREVAPRMGWGAIEIVPTDAHAPGILAGVARLIAEEGISIRQVIVDDPEVVDAPRGFIVTDAPVPARLLPEIRSVTGVQGVVIY